MLHDIYGINEKNHLTLAGVDTVDMAKKYGTPLYLMDENEIRKNCRIYNSAFKKYFPNGSRPLFASKALSFVDIYKIMLDEDMGIDIVSPGELYTALRAGFPLDSAYFHGNNKTDADIEYAINSKIGYFVADNVEELDAIDRIAGEHNIKQKVLLRITPGIDPHTFKAVITGNVDSKFGSAIKTGQAKKITDYALSKKNIELIGFHCHIGSQIFESEPFTDTARIMIKFIKDMKDSFGFETKELNLGGGFGVRYIEENPSIDYEKNIAEISKNITALCEELSVNMPKILMEPGRSIVAAAGITLYTVGTVKEITGFKNYISIDGGMPDNPRYALYNSQYTVLVANKAADKAEYKCTIAGRCCESGDLIAEDIYTQCAKRGDTLAVLVTGAYNYSMASNYNRIPRPPIVLIKDGTDRISVKRESYEDLVKNELN